MSRSNDLIDKADSDAYAFLEQDTISTSNRCKDVDNDIFGAESVELNGEVKHQSTNEECQSMRGQGGSPFKQSEDITRTDSWLDENCSADTYIPSTAALMSEGSGENFQMVASLSRGKKRRRTSEPTHRDDIDDAALDRAASRLEMELSKLESDNKQLISCFVTLGEQVQSMMNENNQMRSVISFANEGTSENCAPTLKALKASFNKSVQDPLALAEISPTVRFLAELALMSGAAANLEP